MVSSLLILECGLESFLGWWTLGVGDGCTCGKTEGQRQDTTQYPVWEPLHLMTNGFYLTWPIWALTCLHSRKLSPQKGFLPCLSSPWSAGAYPNLWCTKNKGESLVTVRDPTVNGPCKRTPASESKNQRESRINPTLRDRRVWRPRDKFFSLSSKKKKN